MLQKIYNFSAHEDNSDIKISRVNFTIDSSKIQNVIFRNNNSVIQFEYEEFNIVIFQDDDLDRSQLQVYPKNEFWLGPYFCCDPIFFITEQSKTIDELTDYLVSIAVVSEISQIKRVYLTTKEIQENGNKFKPYPKILKIDIQV